MSEVIKDLAEQAVRDSLFELFQPTITTVSKGDGQMIIPVVFVEKFAELIVRECLSVMNDQFWGDGHEVHEAMELIKSHFGVDL